MTITQLEGWATHNSPVSALKKGELVRLKNGSPADAVWVRGDYDRSSKRYSLIAFDDVNRERFVKGTHHVWHGFTF